MREFLKAFGLGLIAIAAFVVIGLFAPYDDDADRDHYSVDIAEDEYVDFNGNVVHIDDILRDVECDDYEYPNRMECVYGPTGYVVSK